MVNVDGVSILRNYMLLDKVIQSIYTVCLPYLGTRDLMNFSANRKYITITVDVLFLSNIIFTRLRIGHSQR